MSDLFTSQVRAALGALHDPPALRRHSLAAFAVPPTQSPSAREALRRALLEAVEALRPGTGGAAARNDRAARRHQLLTLRYVEGLPAPEVQRRLGIGRSHYFRAQQQALEAVAAVLEER